MNHPPLNNPNPNPQKWKKRKSGPREFMPPSRALLVEFQDGHKDTATWVVWYGTGWKCISASGYLRWMRGMTDPQRARLNLAHMGVTWHWIEPNTARVLAPPF